MENIITAKKTTVTESIRGYIEKRFSKFEKYVDESLMVYTKIEIKEGGKRHKVEVTIPFGKQVLRAEANSDDMYVAIDDVQKTMSRLLQKRKEKTMQRRQQHGVIDIADESVEPQYKIERTKTHDLPTMTAQEACEAMEMVGHNFYVYMDSNEGAVCAVYARDDGGFGHLVYK